MGTVQPNTPSYRPSVARALKASELNAKQFSDLFSEVRRMRGKVSKIIKGPTTQHLYWDIILFVSENNLMARAVSVSDIYTLGGKSKSTIVSAIKNLEEYKVLEIKSSVQDKRRKSVHVDDLVLSKIIKMFDVYALNIQKILDLK